MRLTASQKALVQECFLFEGCGQMELDAFLDVLEVTAFEKDEVLCAPHRPAKALAILLSGEVAVTGRAGVRLNTLRAGASFGAAGLFGGEEETYVNTLVGCAAGEYTAISVQALTALFEAIPRTAVNYITFLSGRIRFLTQKIERFTAPGACAKLALYLLKQESRHVVMPSGCVQLARELGIGRASLYRAFSALEACGAIAKHEKQIDILEKSRLSQFL